MLNKYKKNIYSENGEDGILLYILKKTKLIKNSSPLWCCEFGAWDGIHGSNTFNLVKNYNFSYYFKVRCKYYVKNMFSHILTILSKKSIDYFEYFLHIHGV